MSSNQTFSPFSHPLYVMLKPAGARCNLACRYCYYLDKALLYGGKGQQLMSEALLEQFTRQYIEAQTQREVLFTWHGGETLLRPLSFYRKALELQQKYANGHLIDNCLQTNGTLLTEEWCEFFRENNWLIGISIDGPKEFHDEYRRSRQMQSPEASPTTGQPSFHKVMRGIRLLQKHGVEWNAMGVVNDFNADYPLDVYHFYKETGCQYIQFAPIVETSGHQNQMRVAPFSVSPKQYAHFCCTIFDEWVRHDVGQVFVQLFDSTLACWAGETPGVCTMCETCGHVSVIEANGDVYSCDHFVYPDYLLGNIHRDTITSMMYSPRQIQFGQAKRDALPHQCLDCQWLFACNGGCPKDRFCQTADGEPGLNYLCPAFQQFFAHVAPYMDFMKNELLCDRAPANVMQWNPLTP